MADDRPKPMDKDHWTTDPVAVLATLFFVGALLSGIVSSIEERFGVSLSDGGIQSGYAWKELTDNTPFGTPVRSIDALSVLDAPGDGAEIGRQPRGAEGEIIDGPIVLGGERWWNIDFAAGPDGWVAGSQLREVNPRSLLTDSTPIGALVSTSFGSVSVYDRAGGGSLSGTQTQGAKGRIIDGPRSIDGERWWQVDFDEGPDGWVLESDLERQPRAAMLAMGIGDSVRTLLEAPLYSDPLGTIGGFVRDDIIGRIIGGPEDIDGDRWWQIEFSDGRIGWLPETVLQRAEIGGFFSFLSSVKFWFTVISVLLSGILLAGIGVVAYRLYQVRSEELMEIWSAHPSQTESEQINNPRWEHVLELVVADNPQSWRGAVIEADIMLDEMLGKMGYVGNSVSDKLKQVARGDFYTLDKAWEAHKIRNQIAHQGSDYILTKREANRVIQLFREVFEEFHYI